MMTMITIIVAPLASRAAVMKLASQHPLHHQCCVIRDDDDHDDNGTGVMIVIIRVVTTSITTPFASLLVP